MPPTDSFADVFAAAMTNTSMMGSALVTLAAMAVVVLIALKFVKKLVFAA